MLQRSLVWVYNFGSCYENCVAAPSPAPSSKGEVLIPSNLEGDCIWN